MNTDWLPDRISDWLKLRRLNHLQSQMDRDGKRVYAEAKAKNEGVLIDNWLDKNYRDLRHLDYSRRELISDSILNEAYRLHLPTPQHTAKAKWQEWTPEPDEDPGVTKPVLSDEGMTELRQAIRKERRERREVWEFWFKAIGAIVTICTGLAGALIGLISVLRHK
jgi:hypothetical protein